MKRFASWPAVSTETRTLVLRVAPERIGYVSAVFESYEGLAVVRTRDRLTGLLELWIMPGQTAIVESILHEFRAEFSVERIREEAGHPDLADDSDTR